MKLRESGMPEESYWETLFDVDLILDRLGIDNRLHDLIEMGCGYGTFTIPVARRISGVLDTFDIEPAMIERTRQRASKAAVGNIRYHERDVLTDGFGLSAESRDACLLFNILHGEEPMGLLNEAARVVRVGGAVHAIHWRYDARTPRGPSLDIRPRPERIVAWAEDTGRLHRDGGPLDLPPWHYGWRFIKS
ncbi:MAG: class I SAM-dependent methyltransferase [Planctomycetes bacterium]|nr:class I SAM-dependent methyltransferase [Planctomycetota bacterium]